MILDTHYAYAVGRVRAVETRLLDKNGLDRMVEARSGEDALKVLMEAGYGASGPDSASVSDYEVLLAKENIKLYKFLKEISPEPEAFSVFLLRNDYHNAKAILKAEFLGIDPDPILLDTGTIPAKKIKLMIRDRKMAEMPPVMRRAVEECIDVFSRTRDPQAIDLLLDRAAFRQMKRTADALGSGFLSGLISAMTDLANIGIFFRVKLMKKSQDFLSRVLLEGGSISPAVFVKSLGDPPEGFESQMKYTAYGRICEEGAESVRNTGSLTRWERLADNYILEYVKKAKFTAFGMEPLIGYLIGKETEMKNVRIIMVGRTNGIPGDIIRERLRETYV